MVSVEQQMVSCLEGCDRFLIANATLSHHAWVSLEPAIRTALDDGAEGQIIIGLDLFQADPRALDAVLRLQRRYSSLSAYLFELRPEGIFHPKLALFQHADGPSVLIGSSNLSHAAWNSNIEADALVRDAGTFARLSELYEAWIEDDRCKVLSAEAIQRAEELWNQHAQERKILTPKQKKKPRIAGAKVRSAAKKNLEHDDLNAWFHEILEAISPGTVGAYKKGDKRPRIECPGQACQYIFLSVREEGERLWLILNLHPGDTVKQARALYTRLDVPAFLALGVHEADESWQSDQWTYHANFHLAFMTKNYVWSDRNWQWDAEEYLTYWQQHQDQICKGKRGDDDFRSVLEPLFDAGMLSRQGDRPEIDKHFVHTIRSEMNICPSVSLTYWWDLDEATQLNDQGELIEQVDFRIRQALSTWTQSLRMGGEP